MRRVPRGLKRACWLLLATAGIAWIGWPILVRAVVGPLLEPEWGGPASIGSAHWFFGDTIVLKDVITPDGGSGQPMLTVGRIELRFERIPLWSSPGPLMAADFLDARLAFCGRPVCSIAAVRYRYDAEHGKHLTIEGLDGGFRVEQASDWVGVIGRIVDAPGIAGDGEGSLMREIQVAESRLSVTLALGGGKAQVLPLEPFACTLHPTAAKALAIDTLTAGLLAGLLRSSGSVDWTNDRIDWHAQANLEHLDLHAAGACLDWLPASSAGTVSAFLDLGTTGDGELGGAGWVEGSKVAVSEQPVAKVVFDKLGVRPERDDVLDEVRVRLLFDRGRLYFEQLVALGRPVNLFGNGSMRLDGSELVAGLVPRFSSKQLKDIPLADDAPSDVLVDIVNGSLVELRVEGGLDGVSVFVQPVPMVTEPMRRFLDLFR